MKNTQTPSGLARRSWRERRSYPVAAAAFTPPPSELAQLRAGITTVTAEETRALAARLASLLPRDATLALHGDLGAGKTTFVQGLARGLGIDAPVTSPTFTIFTIHRNAPAPASASAPATTSASAPATTSASAPAPASAAPAPTLIHLDAYRLETDSQMESLMLEDFLLTPYVLAIEWPEKIAAWIPKDAWHFTLRITDTQKHFVRLER